MILSTPPFPFLIIILILIQSSSLRSRQRAEPCARGQHRNAKRFFQDRQVMVARNDSARTSREGCRNKLVILGVAANSLSQHNGRDPQSRTSQSLQPRAYFSAEVLLLFHPLQYRFVFSQDFFAYYGQKNALQPSFQAQMRLVTPKDAGHEDACVKDDRVHHALAAKRVVRPQPIARRNAARPRPAAEVWQ
jgi:hypothetical protein